MPPEVEFSVSDFVALLNQAMEYSFPSAVIVGELANLRVSKNRWVYFDLKDDNSSVKCFGTVYQLPGPLEDGMLLKVRGLPKLHNLYGFSFNVMNIQPAGEGSIKKAAELLQAKLTAEGLFDPARKRALPYPPRHIGLVTSRQSAAYADFIKIISARWQGLEISVIDVQVQGEPAPGQIVTAIKQFNEMAEPPEVLVLIRGGGSPEDLAAFSTEHVTRAVAASRIPTLVAIGHEVDVSLAELAADQRGSTPSNAAELLVPDRANAMAALIVKTEQLWRLGEQQIMTTASSIKLQHEQLDLSIAGLVGDAIQALQAKRQLLTALSPEAILKRGYALVRSGDVVVRSMKQLQPGATVTIQLADGAVGAEIKE